MIFFFFSFFFFLYFLYFFIFFYIFFIYKVYIKREIDKDNKRRNKVALYLHKVRQTGAISLLIYR